MTANLEMYSIYFETYSIFKNNLCQWSQHSVHSILWKSYQWSRWLAVGVASCTPMTIINSYIAIPLRESLIPFLTWILKAFTFTFRKDLYCLQSSKDWHSSAVVSSAFFMSLLFFFILCCFHISFHKHLESWWGRFTFFCASLNLIFSFNTIKRKVKGSVIAGDLRNAFRPQEDHSHI